MEISMKQIALSALLAVILGTALGAVYDIIRFARLLLGFDVSSPFGKKSPRAFWGYAFVAISDLLFFIILSVSMAVFFFLTGDGRMRSYGLLGVFLGFLLYYHTVGRLFISVSSFLVTLCKKGIKRLLKILVMPFKLAARFVRKITSRILALPIVTRAAKRYNDYISKCKKNAAMRARKKLMKKGAYCRNGGAHEEQ